MKKAFLLIFLLVLGLAGAGYGGYLWWKQTPEASLHRLEVSFEEHDYESFCQYVDVEALAGQFTDNLITVVVQSAKDSFTRDDSYNERVQTLEKRFVPRFRSEGKSLFRKAFQQVVEQSSLEHLNQSLGMVDGNAERADLNKNLDYEPESISDIQREGKIALFTINLTNSRTNRHFELQVKLKRKEDIWQIVALPNLLEFMQETLQPVVKAQFAEKEREYQARQQELDPPSKSTEPKSTSSVLDTFAAILNQARPKTSEPVGGGKPPTTTPEPPPQDEDEVKINSDETASFPETSPPDGVFTNDHFPSGRKRDAVRQTSGVTLENYKKLKFGMSYQEIVDILGGEGVERHSFRTGQTIRTSYEWRNRKGTIHLMFDNQRLTNKFQYGLQ